MEGVGMPSLRAWQAEKEGRLFLDHSCLQSFEGCGRRSFYHYEQGVRNPVGAMAHFSNMMIHFPIEQWYETNIGMLQHDWWEMRYRQFKMAAARDNAPLGRAMIRSVAEGLYHEYIDRFRLDFEMYRVVGVETARWKTLPFDENVAWVTKPDVLLQATDGSFVALEIKVSGSEVVRVPLSFDRQQLGQAWVTGAKQMIRPFFWLKNEEQYRLDRTINQVDPFLLEEWLEELREPVEAFIRAKTTGVWVKRAPSGCREYNRLCQFYRVCSLGKELATKETTHMEIVDPFAYLEKGAGCEDRTASDQ